MMAKIMNLFLLGSTNWGTGGRSVTGASGLLHRVDALCFAALVFLICKVVFWFLNQPLDI
jgi:predicted CDP-diglyceride synthetase/phosphatidate cytidylyltransferase